MAWYISEGYTYLKDGVFYFQRRVPIDLLGHYTSRKIAFSLRTKSQTVALARAAKAAEQLDQHWYHLRAGHLAIPGQHLLRSQLPSTTPAPANRGLGDLAEEEAPTLSGAVALYLKVKGKDRPATFHRGAERSCGYVIEVCGDLPLTAYRRSHANKFRDAMLERGLTGSSIARVVGTIRAVMNFAASETGISLKNPFGGLYLDRKAGVEERLPIPVDALRNVQDICKQTDDDLRWLVALLSDTGLRLAEAAGLHCDDIKLDCEHPHLCVTEHPWRRLKTDGSRRVVPLVGSSLWAAQRVLQASGEAGFAFPRYNKMKITNANSASAALNKWLKDHVPERCTLHSFRHSLRDRLRAVECPSDVVDQIGGWQTEGVGQGYGKGYPLEVLHKWMKRLEPQKA